MKGGLGMDKLLTITCNNFFEVSFRDMLQDEFDVDFIRLDFNNDGLSEEIHFLEQIKLAQQDFRYENDSVFSRYDFPFDMELTNRIKDKLESEKYAFIFLDFRKLNSQAWLLLDFLRLNSDLPLIVFIPKSLFFENNVVKLLSYNVSSVITDFNYSNIVSTLNKHRTS